MLGNSVGVTEGAGVGENVADGDGICVGRSVGKGVLVGKGVGEGTAERVTPSTGSGVGDGVQVAMLRTDTAERVWVRIGLGASDAKVGVGGKGWQATAASSRRQKSKHLFAFSNIHRQLGKNLVDVIGFPTIDTAGRKDGEPYHIVIAAQFSIIPS